MATSLEHLGLVKAEVNAALDILGTLPLAAV